MPLRNLVLAAPLLIGASAGMARAAALDCPSVGLPCLDGRFIIDIYNGQGGGSATSANVQADKDNGLISGVPLARVEYVGKLNLGNNLAQGQQSTIGEFMSSGSGTYSPPLSADVASRRLSWFPFTDTTVFVISFSDTAIPDGSIDHDDGVGLYVNGTLQTAAAAAAPATVTTTGFVGPAGEYELIYVAANGNPSILRVRGTPAPSAPDATGFPCRIDLVQTPVDDDFKFVLTASSSEKFCPEHNGGTLKLSCSGQIPNYATHAPIIDAAGNDCRIATAQCGGLGEVQANTASVKIGASGIVELNCEAPDGD